MVYRRVAAPEGLRRLTSTDKFRARRRTKLASDSSDPAGTEAMSRFGAMDLEAGIRDGEYYSSGQDSRGLASGVVSTARRMLCLLRSWRWWAATVMALQAATIVVLIVRPQNDGKDGVAVTTDSHVHIGPRVAFLADQSPAELNHLIMVPGHGVTITESLDGADRRDADWYLLDYQRDKDVPKALVGHMRGGLDELDADKSSLLVFSGGKTRVLAGPKSEGESYYFVADHYDWWGKPDLRARASTEDFARDSFENILFSICRFKEITGNYPTNITIVGYDFKQERFETLHRAALRFPAEAFHYVGLRPEGRFDHAAAEAGERISALEPYQSDPYGCSPDGPLVTKRAERDPFHRTPPYTLVCPELQELLAWCGPGYFEGNLPWSPKKGEEGEGAADGATSADNQP